MARQPAGAAGDRGKECAVCAAVASVCRTVDRHAATKMRGSAAVLVCVGLGRQTGGLPGLLQCASGPCVVGRADARPDTKGCRTARPLPMGRALPWSLSDADRGVTSDQRRRWRAGRRAPRSTSIATQQGTCVSCTPYSCHRDNFAGETPGSRDPKIERCRIPTNSPPTRQHEHDVRTCGRFGAWLGGARAFPQPVGSVGVLAHVHELEVDRVCAGERGALGEG